jgi:hypothetical protein
VLRPLAALLLAAAPLSAGTMLSAAAPALSTDAWWERITLTMSGDGLAQSCRYEASTAASSGKECDVAESDALAKTEPTKGSQLTRITFERRFIPGNLKPQEPGVAVGDTLLGQQVMALAIDSGGKVSGCAIVVRSGDVMPEYGCEEAKAERFQASASPQRAAAATRLGYMTILIYGHEEQLA